VVWKLDWRGVHEYFGLTPLAFLISDLDELLARYFARKMICRPAAGFGRMAPWHFEFMTA
jgi:hypothetical protein